MTSDGGHGFRLDAYTEALGAAWLRIRRERRRISVEMAEEIVRTEFANRGVPLDSAAAAQHAKHFHRSPFWPLLHPRRARSEGYRIDWPWSRDQGHDDPSKDPWHTPTPVDALANQEAWRLAGRGTGALAGKLEPALCKRISDTDFFCVAEIRSSHDHPAYRVEMRISLRDGVPPRVIDSELRPR